MLVTVAVNHRVDGPEDGPVIVLGNSLGTDLTMWDACAELLVAGGLRVVRYDHRGQGDSADGGGECEISDLGGDVLALLDALGIERAAYAGVSIGGMVALWLAMSAGARIAAIAAFCSSAFPGNPEAWETRSETVLAAGSAEPVAEAVVERWLTPDFAAATPDLQLRLLAMVRATPPEGYARLCRMLARLDLRPQLGAIAIPSLVVAGAQDQSLPPQHSEAIARGIGHARYELLDPAAHIPMVQTPQRVAALILDQMEAVDA